MLRRIVASYADVLPQRLVFANGPYGKPALVRESNTRMVEFNLSHSGDIALVAASAGPHVGIDVEQWKEHIEHLELAERFFSPAERQALHELSHRPERVVGGFFAAWSRKEAYLKATGEGIALGLDHFDVSLVPDEPARLLSDAHDAKATARWTMTAISPAPRYSAALVAAAPVSEILCFDAT